MLSTLEIRASWDTLLDQAKGTGEDYFRAARRVLVDSGLPYTTPDVIALAAVMAQDFHSTAIGVAAQKIESAVNNLSQALGDGLNDMAGAVARSDE